MRRVVKVVPEVVGTSFNYGLPTFPTSIRYFSPCNRNRIWPDQPSTSPTFHFFFPPNFLTTIDFVRFPSHLYLLDPLQFQPFPKCGYLWPSENVCTRGWRRISHLHSVQFICIRLGSQRGLSQKREKKEKKRDTWQKGEEWVMSCAWTTFPFLTALEFERACQGLVDRVCTCTTGLEGGWSSIRLVTQVLLSLPSIARRVYLNCTFYIFWLWWLPTVYIYCLFFFFLSFLYMLDSTDRTKFDKWLMWYWIY